MRALLLKGESRTTHCSCSQRRPFVHRHRCRCCVGVHCTSNLVCCLTARSFTLSPLIRLAWAWVRRATCCGYLCTSGPRQARTAGVAVAAHWQWPGCTAAVPCLWCPAGSLVDNARRMQCRRRLCSPPRAWHSFVLRRAHSPSYTAFCSCLPQYGWDGPGCLKGTPFVRDLPLGPNPPTAACSR